MRPFSLAFVLNFGVIVFVQDIFEGFLSHQVCMSCCVADEKEKIRSTSYIACFVWFVLHLGEVCCIARRGTFLDASRGCWWYLAKIESFDLWVGGAGGTAAVPPLQAPLLFRTQLAIEY